MRPLLLAGLLPAFVISTTGVPAAPFEISESYGPATELVPGTYACRSGLDMDTLTYTFQASKAGYSVQGVKSPDGQLAVDEEGTISFFSGPFAPDDSATMLGRMTSRLSDGNPVIILGYFFADGSDSYDFCALLH
jgi:hypothetical protein